MFDERQKPGSRLSNALLRGGRLCISFEAVLPPYSRASDIGIRLPYIEGGRSRLKNDCKGHPAIHTSIPRRDNSR